MGSSTKRRTNGDRRAAVRRWLRRPESALSLTALAVSIVSFTLSYLQSSDAATIGVMPVVAFVYESDSRWVVRNLGNGPALDVVVARKTSDNEDWNNPIRIPPLPREGRFELPIPADVRALAATYIDVDGREYTATCIDDDSRIHSGRLLRTWSEGQVRPHWDVQK